MARPSWLFGSGKGCVCSINGDHRSGNCPNQCLCETCSCTCSGFCSIGGRVDAKYGGCRCGCILHNHAA